MVAHLELPDWVAGVEVAGPGFVNVRLDQRWFAGLVRRVLAEGKAFGTVDLGHGERVNVEFISANPTGPLHVGNARLAPAGDALANLLVATGHKVEREYYFNDAGSQIEQLGASVEAAYLDLLGRPAEAPADGYKGAYVADLAGELRAEQGDALADLDPAERRARITDWSFRRLLAGIRQTLTRLGVEFDVWFSERTLHETGAIAETVDDLRERGVVEDRDGAVWLRTTMFGDDKDRPLIRSTGAPTYFGADAAYYRDKRRRGFDRLLFLWGADHHGYVPRMRAVVRAFGDPDDTAEFLISQLVSLVRAGQPAKMSKRAGDIATVDDLLDEVGKDAFRYTMLRFSLDAPIEFDVEAVTRQSLDNPVYYVQYAYARISSVLRQGAETGFTALGVDETDLGLLDHPMEAALLRRLAAFEEQVIMAAVQRAPHRLTRYAEELAAAFHRFYAECRVLGDDHALSSARWWLVKATRQVLANTLALIGVDAPERM
jgi:arginyl-tRNA synthetase